MPTDTIIIYQSRSGTAEKAAKLVAEKLDTDPTIINLKKDRLPSLDDYKKIIIGGSIRASMIQSGIKKFIEKNAELLKTKDLGLYLCCMEEGETGEKQFNESYPDNLRIIAKAKGLFGGEFDFDKLNFLEKGIIKKVARVTESISKLDYKAIDSFADRMNK